MMRTMLWVILLGRFRFDCLGRSVAHPDIPARFNLRPESGEIIQDEFLFLGKHRSAFGIECGEARMGGELLDSELGCFEK